jgi:uncharacterized protein (TIGR02265 family)
LYSFELNQRLDRAIARLLSPTNPTRIFVEMGRASAENNLEGPHKVFIRPNEPQRFLAQAPYIYKFYYAAGRRTYEKVGPSAAVIRTYEAESVTAADCLTVVGWHQRALEICGAKGVVVTERQCRTEGHAHCEYLCEWTGP